MSYRLTKKLIVAGVIIFFSCCFEAQAQHPGALQKRYTLTLPGDSLIKTIELLAQKTAQPFAFDPDQLRSERTAPLKFVKATLQEILSAVLVHTRLEFSLVGKDIVIALKKPMIWTIHGHVRDGSTGEELIAATVQIPGLKVGVTTNQYGFYSISVPQGEYEFLVSHTGYQTLRETIKLTGNIQEEIELNLLPHVLDEVVIKPSAVRPNPILMNEQNISSKQLGSASYYAGEADVMKRLQMQNGIKSITEGSSALFIRGGNSDQNLILLDEAIIYNPSHLYGLVSVFNSDAVNNIQVYRDYMPANFGGRLSSVIVNRMAEGNSKEYHLSGGLNLMSARLAMEGPIVKDKGSFIVAYRRSLLDVFQNSFKLFNPNSVYYDINAKTNYKLNSDNSIFYSLYVGKDHLLSDNSYTNNWGNLTSTFRWNHIFSSKVFLNVSAIYSDYSNLLDLNADTLSQKSQWSTGIKDFTLKADFTYYRSPANQIKFGLSGIDHRFVPGEMKDQKDFVFNISRDRSLETALYFTQQIEFGTSFELNYGVRLGFFRNSEARDGVFDDQGNPLTEHDIKSFFKPEPRLNLSYLPAVDQRLFMTYNRNFQYLQLLQNNTLAFSSLEPWIPASDLIKPQRSDHFSFGYRYAPGRYTFMINAYRKELKNQLDLAPHAQIIRNPEIRMQLFSGTSKAYGIEAELSRTEGRFAGTLAYNYSKVYKTVSGINEGQEFVANYDIPHELKLTARMEAGSKLTFQSFFIYSTGRPLTLPVGYYQHDGLDVPIYEGRNSSRFPDFARLDISAQYRFESPGLAHRGMTHMLSAGIYNLFNRRNPLYYHMGSGSVASSRNNVEYGFGFYPWIAYSFNL